jgi:excisionase family DNA binding protein
MRKITLSEQEIVLYDLQEVAEKINTSTRTLYDYIRDGKIRATKIGKKWMISEQSLIDYFNGK